MISQSYIYESLCFLKDWRWLQKESLACSNIRLSHLPVVAEYLSYQDLAGLVAKKIALDQLENSYGTSNFDFASQTISSILLDEKSICIRDLPAYYACATSLLYKLKNTNSMRGELRTKFLRQFDSMAIRITQGTSNYSKLGYDLHT